MYIQRNTLYEAQICQHIWLEYQLKETLERETMNPLRWRRKKAWKALPELYEDQRLGCENGQVGKDSKETARSETRFGAVRVTVDPEERMRVRFRMCVLQRGPR